MSDGARQPKFLAPNLIEMTNGCLSLSFDAPLDHPDRVDWLRVRNWLAEEFGAVFTKAYEYPTFEWFASLTAAGTDVRLWWSDFPDELSLEAQSIEGNALVLRVRNALQQRRPALGKLRSMDARAWRAWMVSLGSPSYL